MVGLLQLLSSRYAVVRAAGLVIAVLQLCIPPLPQSAFSADTINCMTYVEFLYYLIHVDRCEPEVRSPLLYIACTRHGTGDAHPAVAVQRCVAVRSSNLPHRLPQIATHDA
jgi:hypothetical protein